MPLIHATTAVRVRTEIFDNKKFFDIVVIP